MKSAIVTCRVLTLVLLYLGTFQDGRYVWSRCDNTTDRAFVSVSIPECKNFDTNVNYKFEPNINETIGVSSRCYNQCLSKDRSFDTLDIIFYHIKHNRNKRLSAYINLSHKHRLLIIIISGDISLNPGPVKNPRGQCNKPVAKNHRAIYCDACYCWLHIKCAEVSPSDYVKLGGIDDPWICKECNKFHFTDSFFSSDLDISTDLSTCNHPNKFIVAHLNITSLKSKCTNS